MKKLLIIFFSCFLSIQMIAATITFNAMSPAPVSITPDIQSIAIINRTTPKDQKANTIEGIFTGEGMNSDQKAIQAALTGLATELQSSGRFQVIRTTEVLVGSGSGGQFPTPLDWSIVAELCEQYKVDAILSLETFDSDYIITKGKKTGEGFGFYAEGVARVDMGIRMYEPADQSIADQYHFSHSSRFQSQSGTIQEAVIGLMNKDNAFSRVSQLAAIEYVCRISPSWYKISREYFKRSKKDKNLAMGARMMEANDWDAAIEALNQAYEGGHRKTKGRAAHNLAVVYEILGKLEESKTWAIAAWGRHNHKPSKDYGYWLTRRIRQQVSVQSQLNDPKEVAEQ